jgi:hypothetical protein
MDRWGENGDKGGEGKGKGKGREMMSERGRTGVRN